MSRKKVPCPSCGSTKYTRDAQGFLVCQYGHQFQDFRIEEADDFDPQRGQPGRIRLQRRPGKRRAKSQERESYRDVVSSSAWAFLHYEALQIVLHKQVTALVEDMGLPTDLELLVRDIWLLCVTSKNVDAPAASGYAENDDVDQGDEADALAKDAVELSALDTGSEDSDEERSGGSLSRPKASHSSRRSIPIEWTAATLYIACRWLGLPIMMADIHTRICDGRLPFLNAERCLPAQIANRLYAKRRRTFHVASVPSVTELHGAVRDIEQLLAPHMAQAHVPDIRPQLVARLCLELTLPVEAFALARYVTELLGGVVRNPGSRQLLFGLDGRQRIDDTRKLLQPPLPSSYAVAASLGSSSTTAAGPAAFLAMARVQLGERHRTKNVEEFASVRGSTGLHASADASTRVQDTGGVNVEIPQRPGSPISLTRGEGYVVFGASDRTGDVPAQYGAVVGGLAATIRSSELELHDAVGEWDRHLSLLGEAFEP